MGAHTGCDAIEMTLRTEIATLQVQVEELREELDSAHRFLNDIGPPPDLPLPDRLRHWQNYCRLMRDDMRGKDATIAMLREAAWALARRHHEWGHMGSRMATPIEECLIETCVEIVKALAPTAQEDE